MKINNKLIKKLKYNSPESELIICNIKKSQTFQINDIEMFENRSTDISIS